MFSKRFKTSIPGRTWRATFVVDTIAGTLGFTYNVHAQTLCYGASTQSTEEQHV